MREAFFPFFFLSERFDRRLRLRLGSSSSLVVRSLVTLSLLLLLYISLIPYSFFLARSVSIRPSQSPGSRAPTKRARCREATSSLEIRVSPTTFRDHRYHHCQHALNREIYLTFLPSHTHPRDRGCRDTIDVV